MTSTDFYVEAIDWLSSVCGSILMKNGHNILPVLKEATSLTFERSINLIENVTSSNICHNCWTQRCPLSRGVRYSEVSASSQVSAIQRFCTNSRRSKEMCPLFGDARY